MRYLGRAISLGMVCATVLAYGPPPSINSEKILLAYQELQRGLAQDDFDGAKKAAKKIFLLVDPATSPSDKSTPAIRKIRVTSKNISETPATDIAGLRTSFALLSEAMAEQIKVDPKSKENWTPYYCPMAKRSWIQAKSDKTPMNPYFGKAMQQCGEAKLW